MNDYRILAPPRISEATFERILRNHGSPAEPEASLAYTRIVRHGVDPALALAVFQHESSFGTKGAAKPRKNWGNVTRSPDFKVRLGRFVKYPTWADGAGDAARLLAVYGNNRISKRKTDTALKFPYVWAPSSDGNKPAAYGRAIVAAIDRYMERERQWKTGATTTPVAPHAQAAPSPAVGMVSRLDHSRIRARPALDAPIVRVVRPGVRAVVARVVAGGRYEVNGVPSDRWVEITALNGVRLPTSVFSAATLWVLS